MKRLCVKQYRKDGLDFVPGLEYEVEYNPIDRNMYIYTVWGYTTMPPFVLNSNFI